MKNEFYILRIAIICVIFLAVACLYFIIDARTSGFFPSCPFHKLTGLFCPGCGSQRAISSLLHLNLKQAVHYNILLVISLPLLAYSAYVHVVSAVRKQPLYQPLFHSPVFVKLILALVVVFSVLRNIPVYPFTAIAP